MEVKKVKLSALRLNDGNPRIIKDFKFQKLVKSLLTFPEMLRLREIVTDEAMMVLGGNMRCRALMHIAQMTEQELKQELKKTTDDCYTPELIYDAVVEWVEKEYDVKRKDFVRPFYPGGDYKNFNYPKGSVVVDNPPFSILAEILQFYDKKGIKFFLFAPSLTLFSSSSSSSTAICIGVGIIYANGAGVNTSFLTNLGDRSIRFRSAPDLYKALDVANTENLKQMRKELPKYTYPDHIVTSTFVGRMSKYGIDISVSVGESEPISALDHQKKEGKAIYGKGYIISEKAAAEKAAATRWLLSDKEWEIIKRLSQ